MKQLQKDHGSAHRNSQPLALNIKKMEMNNGNSNNLNPDSEDYTSRFKNKDKLNRVQSGGM